MFKRFAVLVWFGFTSFIGWTVLPFRVWGHKKNTGFCGGKL